MTRRKDEKSGNHLGRNDWSVASDARASWGAGVLRPYMNLLDDRELRRGLVTCRGVLLLGGFGEFAGGFDDLLGEVVADARFVASDREICGTE